MVKSNITTAELNQIRAFESTAVSPDANAAGSTFIRLLSTLDRELVTEIMTQCHYQPGEVLFREGEAGDALFLIWAGRVAVIKGSFASPDEVLIRIPGEVVGEMALLENKPRWASLVALEQVRALRIEREGFQKLLQAQPAISLNLLALLSSRLRSVHETHRADLRQDQQLLHQLSSLIDENEQLMELDRVRQETSDLIVHDLRSPLNNMYSVLNMLELVLPEDILSANRELLDIAKLAHSRMQDLVDSLLDVSKLQTGELMLDLAPVSLKQLIDEVVAMASFAINQHSIVFQTSFAPDLPLLLIDEDRIRRVLTNLIDNAVKYTPRDGRVRVEVSVGEGMMETAVIDSGPGIPLVDRQRIFERFAQVQRVGLRRTRGFGLGLAFCRLAVEAHGGQIWVESGENDTGSRFVFTLPLPAEPLM